MTIWISWELSLFNFKHLNILCAWIGCLCEKLWPFEILESFRCSISSVLIYYVPESHIEVKIFDLLNFSRASVVQFWAFDILCPWIAHLGQKLWLFEFSESFRCSISSVLIFNAPESDLRVKSYDHLNFSRASIVQFRASRYVKHLNRMSELKVMTIWISRELPLFNFERLDILCPLIGHPS